jgi:hypothetical protein
MDEQGNPSSTYIDSEKGNYIGLFEAVYQSIVNDIAYPVTEEQIIAQLEILEA